MSALGSSRKKYLMNCIDSAFALALDGGSLKLYDKAGVRHIYERSCERLCDYGDYGAKLAIIRNAKKALKTLLKPGNL